MLCSKIAIHAQIPFIRDYWLNEQYTSVNVQSILQDDAGYILIGTDEGLFRFNGADFSKIQGYNEAVSTLSFIKTTFTSAIGKVASTGLGASSETISNTC